VHRHHVFARLLGFCSVAALVLGGRFHFTAAHEPVGRKHGEGKQAVAKLPDFLYDQADVTVDAEVLDSPLWYDADVADSGRRRIYAWLELVPGKGDRLWVGQRGEGRWKWKFALQEKPAEYARPTLTVDASERVWLSFESPADGAANWDLHLAELKFPEGDGPAAIGKSQRVSDGPGSDIRHRVAADARGGLWLVWQSDRDGQFEIVTRRVADGQAGPVRTISDSTRGDWHPAVACDPGGNAIVAWDGHDGESYHVHYRWIASDGQLEPIRRIDPSPAFQGRADVAIDPRGRAWLAWEEGGENWGRPYRPKLQTTNMTDHLGPLHRFRRLRLAVVSREGNQAWAAADLPLPSLQRAAERTDTVEGVSLAGAFYERARLAFDRQGRLWVAYRHFYTPWLGVKHRSHVEAGWGVYARFLRGKNWSRLYRFSIGQGDGMQRLELAPSANGVAAAWTAGRTHRAKVNRPRGVILAEIDAGSTPSEPAAPRDQVVPTKQQAKSPSPKKAATVTFDRRQYHLFYGDLHRHTDLSLCRVPIDGTIDDAYRYAVDAAELDFLGITDHSRDLAQGDALSLLWWRSRKEVYRHELAGRFYPLYAYERSHGNTADHNVISLKDDMLRPHTYPVPKFWEEIDPRTTITIPHQPIRRDTWNYQDDQRRPLAEIYQGARDRVIDDAIHRGLSKGYRLGLIASSDHMSTSASYACVWAEDVSREAIFRALRDRRTFGATARIRLVVRAGEHWMGQELQAAETPPWMVSATGTAPIRAVNFVVDGKVVESLSPNSKRVELKHALPLTGKHYVYVHVLQADGNQAWSSPIWVDIAADKQRNKK